MRSVAREVRDLDRDVAHHLAPFESSSSSSSFNPSAQPAIACALLVDHLCMRRNKRCLLAYHRVRAEKLEEMCWRGVDVLEQQQATSGDAGPEGEEQNNTHTTTNMNMNMNTNTNVNANTATSGQNSLSPEEEEYFRLYSEMLSAYKGRWTDVDLTGSLEPPKDLFIDVRVLRDAGEIQTEYGCVSFSKMFHG